MMRLGCRCKRHTDCNVFAAYIASQDYRPNSCKLLFYIQSHTSVHLYAPHALCIENGSDMRLIDIRWNSVVHESLVCCRHRLSLKYREHIYSVLNHGPFHGSEIHTGRHHDFVSSFCVYQSRIYGVGGLGPMMELSVKTAGFFLWFNACG